MNNKIVSGSRVVENVALGFFPNVPRLYPDVLEKRIKSISPIVGED